MDPKTLRIEEYDYPLSPEYIPDSPPADRSSSRLLHCDGGEIADRRFAELPELLQPADTLFLNNTRVIPARLIFSKPTGGQVEVFCLEPRGGEYATAMAATASSTWLCLVGGSKKWKEGFVHLAVPVDGREPIVLNAERLGADKDGQFIIRFSWDAPMHTFADLLDRAGRIPIPPYFRREPNSSDRERYQTVFAKWAGSVAAPTAGLHFTDELLQQLNSRGIKTRQLTLHVGAGTFKPVSSDTLGEHPMHGEWFEVSRTIVEELSRPSTGRRIAVGTTSMRTLESLYWIGVKLSQHLHSDGDLRLNQWENLSLPDEMSLSDALGQINAYMLQRDEHFLRAHTSLLIAPGYRFRVCDALITNFHLPKSTLLVLVAALIGSDWQRVYTHAIRNNYRFLSYGDSSLLVPQSQAANSSESSK